MSALFGDDMIERPIPELPEGAHFVPGWLTLEQQRWAVDRFHEWARGLCRSAPRRCTVTR